MCTSASEILVLRCLVVEYKSWNCAIKPNNYVTCTRKFRSKFGFEQNPENCRLLPPKKSGLPRISHFPWNIDADSLHSTKSGIHTCKSLLQQTWRLSSSGKFQQQIPSKQWNTLVMSLMVDHDDHWYIVGQ